MNERYIYVFLRKDIPLADQQVANTHATYHMALGRHDNSVPNVVVIEIADEIQMNKVGNKVTNGGLTAFVWQDPDKEDGITAIVTEPLEDKNRAIFKNYRLYK